MTTTQLATTPFQTTNLGWMTATPDWTVICNHCPWVGSRVINGRYRDANGVERFARRYIRLSFDSRSEATTFAYANHGSH